MTTFMSKKNYPVLSHLAHIYKNTNIFDVFTFIVPSLTINTNLKNFFFIYFFNLKVVI